MTKQSHLYFALEHRCELHGHRQPFLTKPGRLPRREARTHHPRIALQPQLLEEAIRPRVAPCLKRSAEQRGRHVDELAQHRARLMTGAISGSQWFSVVLKGSQRFSEVLKGSQWSSEVLRGSQWSSTHLVDLALHEQLLRVPVGH